MVCAALRGVTPPCVSLACDNENAPTTKAQPPPPPSSSLFRLGSWRSRTFSACLHFPPSFVPGKKKSRHPHPESTHPIDMSPPSTHLRTQTVSSPHRNCNLIIENSMFCSTCSTTTTLVGSNSGQTARSKLPSSTTLTP